MNKKYTISILVLGVLVIGAFFVLSKEKKEVIDQNISFSGVVNSVDHDQIAFDGPSLISIRAQDGSLQTIAIPSSGFLLCPAKDSIADIFEIVVGDTIEVNGARDADGYIVPCAEEAHYLTFFQRWREMI